MRALPLRPPPMPTEPLVDYLDRLGSANGYSGRELWSILDSGLLPHPKVLTEAINRHSLPNFSGPTETGIEIAVELYGLQSADFAHRRRKWCPYCIQEGAWFRPIWRLKVATVCTTHRVGLLQVCKNCNRDPEVESILRGTCSCSARFGHATVPANQEEISIGSALEKSLVQSATLDLGEAAIELTAAQLVRMICYIGQFIKGPDLSRPGKIRELEDLRVASDLVGGTASLLSDWPAAFWRCLDRFVRAAPEDASVRRVFGPLYHVIYQDLRDPAFQFLRDAFELFLLEHWRGELCGRHRLFNQERIKGHRHQGLTRVARGAGVSSTRLRRLVHQDRFPASQFNPTSKRQFVTIEKDAIERLIPNPDDYLDLRGVARLFGLKRTRLRQLVAHGIILADAKPDFGIGNRWHFRRSEIKAFLAEFRQSAISDLPGDEVVTLAHVLQFWRLKATELGELMRALKCSEVKFSMPQKCRLSDINFNEQELRAWLTRIRASTVAWVSVSKASEFLGLKEQVVYELVAKNLLVPDVVSTRGRVLRRISLPSLQRFQETFVSLAELAKIYQTSSSALLKRIDALPVTGPKIDGGRQYFYKRCDVPLSVLS